MNLSNVIEFINNLPPKKGGGNLQSRNSIQAIHRHSQYIGYIVFIKDEDGESNPQRHFFHQKIHYQAT